MGIPRPVDPYQWARGDQKKDNVWGHALAATGHPNNPYTSTYDNPYAPGAAYRQTQVNQQPQPRPSAHVPVATKADQAPVPTTPKSLDRHVVSQAVPLSRLRAQPNKRDKRFRTVSTGPALEGRLW